MDDDNQLEQQAERLVSNYQPSEQSKQLILQARPVFLAGISGAGKDTIKQELLKTEQFYHIVSHTTREPRSNNGIMEVDGEDYHFISMKQAVQMLERQAFVEAKFVHGTIYASSAAEYARAVASGKTPIADIDVQGVVEYKKLAPNTKALFILPPSYEVWMERLKKRFSSEAEFLAAWPKRRDSSIMELEFALSSHVFEWVINGDFGSAIISARQLIDAPSGDFATAEQKQIAKELLTELKADKEASEEANN